MAEMKKSMVCLFAAILLCGCGAAINLQGKVASVSSGKFIYKDGNLITEYDAGIDVAWAACEKTFLEMQAREVQKERKISSGVIRGIIQDEKVTIRVQYVSLNKTTVFVFVGVAGNRIAARLIHDKIAAHLPKT